MITNGIDIDRKWMLWMEVGKITMGELVNFFKVADLSPKNMFGNYPPQMVTKPDLNIGVLPGFGGLIQGQIYNPVFCEKFSMALSESLGCRVLGCQSYTCL